MKASAGLVKSSDALCLHKLIQYNIASIRFLQTEQTAALVLLILKMKREVQITVEAAAPSYLGDQTSAVGSEGLEILLFGSLSFLLVDVLVVGVEGVPHGGHDLGHLTERCVGV